jgi:preprotein translocase subunit SecD
MRRKIWITFGLVMLLVAVAGLVDWPQGPNIRLGNFQREINVRLGLDLQGGTSLVYQADVNQVPEAERATALDGVRDVIDRRINAFGVAEPVVQTARVGSQYRVNIELAGVKDIDQAIKMIGETPLLEFREQTGPTGLADADAKKLAEEILVKTKAKGADFSALAKEFSNDPSAQQNGGDLGWAKPGQFVPEFETALFDQLKPGDITGPIKTQFGYHIIKKIEQREINENGQTVLEVHGAHILIATTETAGQLADYTPTQ